MAEEGAPGVPNTAVTTVQGILGGTPLSVAIVSGGGGGGTGAGVGTAGTPSADVLSVQGITGMTALKVDASATTQPISAAALPLPTGAATLAKQPALGTAGSASADVISVQGIASGTPLGISGATGGYTAIVSGNFTRPANTTAYASGQLVANSTTAGSVVAVTLAAGRISGGTGQIIRARLTKSSTNITTASFRIHLYGATPTASNGDGGVWLTNNLTTYIGSLDTTISRAFTTGAKGLAVPTEGQSINYQCVGQNLFALIEARSAYTPTSGEVFTIDLEVLQD